MKSVEELERALLQGARRELGPSASDRMRVQTLLLGNEAWFQPAPARRSSLRSFTRSWRGGVAMGFALGALVGFGASQGLGLLSSPEPVAPEQGAPLLAAAPIAAAPAPAAPSSPAAPVGPSSEQVAAAGDEGDDAPAGDEPPPVARRETAPRSRTAASDEQRSTLAQELALLQRARRALNRQDGRLALGIVQSLDERFPNGVLMEERAATRILSLCQLERTDEARAHGQQFLAAHPRSIYAERVLRSCAGKQ